MTMLFALVDGVVRPASLNRLAVGTPLPVGVGSFEDVVQDPTDTETEARKRAAFFCDPSEPTPAYVDQ